MPRKIFVMSINGSTSKDFHKYCDNKGPTLTIVKTTKNKIFGGYPLNWILMDVLNMIKIIKLSYRDFSIESNMKTAEAYANTGTNFLSNNNLELTGDKGDNISFDIEDFEIFKVNY